MSTAPTLDNATSTGVGRRFFQVVFGRVLPSQVVVVVIVCALVILGWACLILNSPYFSASSGLGERSVAPARTEPSSPNTNTNLPAPNTPVPIQQSDDFHAKQLQAVSQSQLIAVRYRLEQIQQLLRDLQSTVARLKQDVDDLAINEAGRQIVGNATALARYALYVDSRLPTIPPAHPLEQRFSQIKASIAQSQNQLFSLTRDIDHEIISLNDNASDALAQARQVRLALDAILEITRNSSPASTPLKDALAKWNVNRENKFQRLIDEQIATTTSRINQELADAEDEKRTAKSNLDDIEQRLASEQRASLEAKTVRDQEAGKNQIARSQQRAATREQFLAALPAIRTHLTPFISPGYVQPKTDRLFEHTTEKTPMSISALLRIGALEPTDEGREILLRVGGSKLPGFTNDRPLGVFPQYTSEFVIQKQTVITELKLTQKLLRDFGEFMVEEEFLSP